MTREDAISILNVIVHMLEPKYDTDRVEEAFDMAFKALEQEPNIDMESEEIKILQKRAYLEGFHEALKMSVKQEPLTDVLDKIKTEIKQYQADCDLSCSDDGNCKTCNNITFGSIYRIIDKYKADVIK